MRFGDPGVIHARMCSELGEQRAVAVHHALGVARRARRVREHAHVVGVGGARSRSAGAARVDDVPRRRAARACGASASADRRPRRAARDRAARRARRRRRCRGSRRGRSGRRRCTRARRLWPRMKRTSFGAVDVHDRHEHVAAHREAVERDDRLPPVRQLERDDGAGLEPGVGERGDQPQRVGVDLGVGAVPRARLRPDVRRSRRARARRRRSTSAPSVSSVHQPSATVALAERGRAPAAPATARTSACRHPHPPTRSENHASEWRE